MRSDPIVSNLISSNLIDRDKRSNRAMRLDAIRLLKTLKRSIKHICKIICIMELETNMTLCEAIDLAGILDSFGAMLSRRFERTGSIDDLNRAVDVTSMAVDATPQDHPDRAVILSNLGSHLSRRFERTGSIDDLNRAVDVASMAVDATPQDHPDRASMLSKLGSHLSN